MAGARAVVGVLACVLVAGCSGSESSTPAPQPAPSTPPASVDQSAWLTAQVEVAQPDGLAAFGDSVYVKTDTGTVVRVDAADATVVGSATIDTYNDAGHYCTGIGTDGTSLWACSAGRDGTDVVRLDPDTLEVLDRVRIDKVFDQLTLPVVDGRVWVLSGTGDHLTYLDTDTRRRRTWPLDQRCFQLAATAGRVYATCLLADLVLALDATTGEVVARADVPHPTNISAIGDQVWVSTGTGLHQFSADLEPLATYEDLVAGAEGDVVATTDAVWVRQAAGFLFRLDLATGATTQYVADPVPSGGSVLVTDDAVWTSAFNDDVVYRLDPGLA
jgi:glutamine cyclotransferase